MRSQGECPQSSTAGKVPLRNSSSHPSPPPPNPKVVLKPKLTESVQDPGPGFLLGTQLLNGDEDVHSAGAGGGGVLLSTTELPIHAQPVSTGASCWNEANSFLGLC